MIYIKKFGMVECISTIGCMTLVPLVLSTPVIKIKNFGTSSFLSVVYSSLIAAFFFFLLFSFLSKYKSKDILDISEIFGGKVLKKFTSILFTLYFLVLSSITLCEFSESIKNILFDKAPTIYILSIFMLTILIACLLGIKGILRTSTIIFPFIFIGIIAMLISLQKEIELTNFTPILGNCNLKEFLSKGLFSASGYESLIILLFLAPCVKNIKETAKKSYLLIMFMIAASFYLINGIFSYPTLLDNHSPFYELTKLISYGRFIQRVESIFVLFWIIATFIYVSISISISASIIKSTFEIKNVKKIIITLCILILISSLILTQNANILAIRTMLQTYISPIMMIGYPLILLIFATFKNNNKETNYEKK